MRRGREHEAPDGKNRVLRLSCVAAVHPSPHTSKCCLPGSTAPRSLPQRRTCTGARTPGSPGRGMAARRGSSPALIATATRPGRTSPGTASAAPRSSPSTMPASMALVLFPRMPREEQARSRLEADVGRSTAPGRSVGSPSSATTPWPARFQATAWSCASCGRRRSSACRRISSRASTNCTGRSPRVSRPATTRGPSREWATARSERRPAMQRPRRRRDSHRICPRNRVPEVNSAAVLEEDPHGWR